MITTRQIAILGTCFLLCGCFLFAVGAGVDRSTHHSGVGVMLLAAFTLSLAILKYKFELAAPLHRREVRNPLYAAPLMLLAAGQQQSQESKSSYR